MVSHSVWPHRWQPTRLHCPWDSPGKNTGVGCHFLLQCSFTQLEAVYVYVYTCMLYSVAQLCQLFATLWTAAHQTSLSFMISQSLLKLMSIESIMPYLHRPPHTSSNPQKKPGGKWIQRILGIFASTSSTNSVRCYRNLVLLASFPPLR